MIRVMMERETEMERGTYTTKKRIAKEESQMSAALCFACKMAYTQRYDLWNRQKETNTGSAKLRRIAASHTIQRKTWKVFAHMLFFYV